MYVQIFFKLWKKIFSRIKTLMSEIRMQIENEKKSQNEGNYTTSAFTKYPLLVSRFKELISSARSPYHYYAWGALCGADLAKELKIPRISLIEMGVAGGNGLVALERIAVELEKIYDIKIDVYGFDTGHGLPKPKDYRDCPNQWEEGFYPMNEEALRSSLKKAQLILGPLNNTIESFIKLNPVPIAFIGFDVDYYSSTIDAFKLLDGSEALFLPRVQLYFDDIMGYSYGDFTGERLAIAEFNNEHASRKISNQYGLRYFVKDFYSMWPDMMYIFHIFDHHLYTQRDGMIQPRGSLLPLTKHHL